jgi:glycosyltransferase involved in cell wall biosynthesis
MSRTSQPPVTVVIPFFNCTYIDQAIDSVLHQTYPNIEILVVDDGSTIHQDKLHPYFSSIRYVHKPNGGTATALNYGISLSQGEYTVWLSSDDLMVPHKIEAQLDYMMHHQALISCTDFHLIDGNSQLLIASLAAKYPNARLFIEALLTFCPINGSTVMMHRSLQQIVGWFNESLLCTQDYEYWMRVHLARVDFHYINEPLTHYRWHDGMGTQRKKQFCEAEFIHVRDRYAPDLHALLSLL